MRTLAALSAVRAPHAERRAVGGDVGAGLGELVAAPPSSVSGRAPTIVTSPPAAAAAAANVPVSMRSGMTACVAPCSFDTPSIVMRSEPAPVMRAPIAPQARGEIDDLGLARGVLEHGDAVGERRGHHQVLGAGDGDHVEHESRAGEARRRAR